MAKFNLFLVMLKQLKQLLPVFLQKSNYNKKKDF